MHAAISANSQFGPKYAKKYFYCELAGSYKAYPTVVFLEIK